MLISWFRDVGVVVVVVVVVLDEEESLSSSSSFSVAGAQWCMCVCTHEFTYISYIHVCLNFNNLFIFLYDEMLLSLYTCRHVYFKSHKHNSTKERFQVYKLGDLGAGGTDPGMGPVRQLKISSTTQNQISISSVRFGFWFQTWKLLIWLLVV